MAYYQNVIIVGACKPFWHNKTKTKS